MDYEQKYKDALERAKNIYGASENEDILHTLETLFPELKGNEYESTRKRIIALVNAHGQGRFKESMLAWLEKQELTSNSYSGVSISPDNGVDILFDKKLVKHISGEEQAEQNLNACLSYIPDESLRRWLTDTIHAKYDKIAWSEEDEKRFKSCLNILQPKTLLGNTETINTKWFKSLKDRIQP